MLETCSRARAVRRPDLHQIANQQDYKARVLDWRLVAAGILILRLSAVAFAQQPAENKSKAEPLEQQKAFAMLELVASRIPTLRSPENRILLSVAVADLVWEQDEERARGLFDLVTREMASLIVGIPPDDNQVYDRYALVYTLRQEIIARMAPRDPQIALNFLRATRLTHSDASLSDDSMERNLEFQLARSMAAKNPERALELARKSLEQGVSHEAGSVLSELLPRSEPAAASFYESLVERIKTENLGENLEATNVACNLLTSFTPPTANKRLYGELLETVVKAALAIDQNDLKSLQRAQNLYGYIGRIMDQVEKHAPDQLQPLREWKEKIGRGFSNSSSSELETLIKHGNVENILEFATKSPPESRNHIYQQAAWKAAAAGDTARARQIAQDLISDPFQRMQLLEQLEQQSLSLAISENRLGDARALIRSFRTAEKRMHGLLHLGSMLTNNQDKRQAVSCLDEARSLLPTAPRSTNRLTFEMNLAMAYSTVDQEQSFALMESVASQLNELTAAAAVLDGFGERYLSHGEFLANGSSNIGYLVGNMRRNLSHLARLNFERARAVTEQLERSEIRLLTQIEMATMVLQRKVTPRSGLGYRRRLR